MKDAQAVIVFAVHLDEEVIRDAPGKKYNTAVPRSFRMLRIIAQKASRWLRAMGYNAHPCHNQADIGHKRDAELAGLGKIGDHTLLITPEYGCRVHLNSVITNALLIPDKPVMKELCDHCEECIRRYPANAILDKKRIAKDRCINYRKNNLKRNYCGICMKVCWEHLKLKVLCG